MSEEEICFLSLAEATGIVGAIQEEEDIERLNHRVFTVYSKDDKALCWFEFDEIMKDANPGKGEDAKEKVTDYIMKRIPDWVLDM
ncbi:MAG: hypothetical protein KAI85_02895 [Halopseudomonas aestusnigri]|nr:hypothetical protein [Halopseudomonas aestusnigri]